MSDDVLCRENLMDLVYFLRRHKAPQDAPELCDWSCECNGRLDRIVAHDAALRERVEELEAVVREELCNCGPVDDPDLEHHADHCRARQALQEDDDG